MRKFSSLLILLKPLSTKFFKPKLIESHYFGLQLSLTQLALLCYLKPNGL